MTYAECGVRYEQCQAEFFAIEQACYYGGGYGAYATCYQLGEMISECINPIVGESEVYKCIDTYEGLYGAYGGACGEAFLSMMACISFLDCQALSDKADVYANCGPQIQNKNYYCQ